MFAKLLIANRGEIACRVARTARRLGVRTVAVYSDADAQAAHVAACDEAVHLGGSRPQESYLRGEAILEAARRTGAEAIHPGYGFLSENAAFATACAEAGIVFVGPAPESILAMGSKSAAKAIMEAAGVPLTPGYHGDNQHADYLLQQAGRIGFPVLIKAVAGGGGKGMRRVDRGADFAAALASCRREAAASFKDDRVLVEKYLTGARHIEIQVFGDMQGNVVQLFERDCSVQRRHQKVLEESPAPGLTAERRRAMGEAAVAAARAVNYRGAGTVEFIVAPDGAFYFMEMNTRLQVEHAVTEMVTGLDLVEWQLRVSAGEPLPLKQEQLRIQGHAIEARIYAEDPSREFLPSIGRLEYLATPAPSPAVRVDTGVRQGDEITPFYDPMIAKLIVHGSTRALALAGLRAALGEFRVVGVVTNIEFLARLTTAPSFQEARLDTALIERERAHLWPTPAPPPPAAWAQAAQAMYRTTPADCSPWSDAGGWRLGPRAARSITLRSGEWHKTLRVLFTPQGPVASMDEAQFSVAAGEVIRSGSWLHVFQDGAQFQFQADDPYEPPVDLPESHGGLVAPMPGRVLEVLVRPGDKVVRGAPLIVMEAMKMEHTITAPTAGVVSKVCCATGEQVAAGAELLALGLP